MKCHCSNLNGYKEGTIPLFSVNEIAAYYCQHVEIAAAATCVAQSTLFGSTCSCWCSVHLYGMVM